MQKKTIPKSYKIEKQTYKLVGLLTLIARSNPTGQVYNNCHYCVLVTDKSRSITNLLNGTISVKNTVAKCRM